MAKYARMIVCILLMIALLSGCADEGTPQETGAQSTGAPSTADGFAYTGIAREHWLAAAAVNGISMFYPDFTELKIYAAAYTGPEDPVPSKGVYLRFSSMGEAYCLEISPLKAERDSIGSVDLYSDNTGYATFDAIEPEKMPEGFQQVEIENLGELIGKCERVMLYQH